MVNQIWPTLALLILNFSYFNWLEKLQNVNTDLHVIRLFVVLIPPICMYWLEFFFSFYSDWSCHMCSAKQRQLSPPRKIWQLNFAKKRERFLQRCTTSFTKYREQQVEATWKLFLFWIFLCPLQGAWEKGLTSKFFTPNVSHGSIVEKHHNDPG